VVDVGFFARKRASLQHRFVIHVEKAKIGVERLVSISTAMMTRPPWNFDVSILYVSNRRAKYVQHFGANRSLRVQTAWLSTLVRYHEFDVFFDVEVALINARVESYSRYCARSGGDGVEHLPSQEKRHAGVFEDG
jgi:hypothetical protein